MDVNLILILQNEKTASLLLAIKSELEINFLSPYQLVHRTNMTSGQTDYGADTTALTFWSLAIYKIK